jgi:hypothetical protein
MPTHMSSEDGSHVTKRPPSAACSASPLLVRNTTSVVVVTDGLYISYLTRPLPVFIILGIELIRNATFFLEELIGVVLMAFLRFCFLQL